MFIACKLNAICFIVYRKHNYAYPVMPPEDTTTKKLDIKDQIIDTTEVGLENSQGNKLNDAPEELGGRDGLDPTRYGDWEKNGRCIDF